jgi:hypothetical protein
VAHCCFLIGWCEVVCFVCFCSFLHCFGYHCFVACFNCDSVALHLFDCQHVLTRRIRTRKLNLNYFGVNFCCGIEAELVIR